MLQTNFRENQPSRSGEEDFEGFLPYMGMAAILVIMKISPCENDPLKPVLI